MCAIVSGNKAYIEGGVMREESEIFDACGLPDYLAGNLIIHRPEVYRALQNGLIQIKVTWRWEEW